MVVIDVREGCILWDDGVVVLKGFIIWCYLNGGMKVSNYELFLFRVVYGMFCLIR